MTDTLKRFISTASVTYGNIHSGPRCKGVQAYLEQERLKSWVDASPALNEAGAETVEVVAHGHKGGSFSAEPFHASIRVRDRQGKLLTTKNPRTGKATMTWHAYIEETMQDLANKKSGRRK